MSDRDIPFPPKDEPLRRDVSVLGAMVGEILVEQGGETLFARVEAARQAAIQRRQGAGGAEEALCEAVDGLTPAAAEEVVRGFGIYFQVVNLAERVHRLRRRRDYLRTDDVPQRGSLADALTRLRDAGTSLETLTALLGTLLVEPVFTAHPTEATRRTILEKEQRIARLLVDRFDPSRTPDEEAAALGRIRATVTSVWQTEEHPGARPTVADEAEHVLFYLTQVIYRVIPPFYESLRQALVRTYGDAARDLPLPVVVRFASWVGGDMDGNPNVTADTIRTTLARHRALILRRYFAELDDLAQRLSQTRGRVEVDPAVEARIVDYGARFPNARDAIHPRHRSMPYRVLLRLMAARVEATYNDAADGYETAAALGDDLRLVLRSLEAHKGAHAGAFGVRRLLLRLHTFGFHLATLDVRQDALVHRIVVGRLLAEEGWTECPADGRAARLRQALETGEAPTGSADEAAQATLQVFAAIAACHQRYGRRAIGPYIISMAQGVDDVLTVLLLARWGGLVDDDGTVPLDIAPLFETVPDLQAAPDVLNALFSDPLYRPHLASRRQQQVVMIGYSDSSKDGGVAASRWALQQAQATMVAVADEAGMALTLFHGRGGTVSRGGGKTRRAILAAPRGAVNGRLRMTEQGEVIDGKFGLRGIALRTFEQTVGAVMRATLAPTTTAPTTTTPDESTWQRIMAEVAAASRRAYRDLVYGEAGYTYFRQATPIDVIERLRIGSRPASRRAGGGIESLRAIPWVFAWTQSRHLLPGWYGLGTALAAAAAQYGMEPLLEMASSWPFFRTLLDDTEMVLAKADMPIAARYAALADDASFFPRIREEHGRTVEWVLRLKESDTLLANDPTLRRSIQLRNPYVDPMSLLQVDLLRRWRATDRQDDALLQALFATVGGIAQGLQNTG